MATTWASSTSVETGAGLFGGAYVMMASWISASIPLPRTSNDRRSRTALAREGLVFSAAMTAVSALRKTAYRLANCLGDLRSLRGREDETRQVDVHVRERIEVRVGGDQR